MHRFSPPCNSELMCKIYRMYHVFWPLRILLSKERISCKWGGGGVDDVRCLMPTLRYIQFRTIHEDDMSNKYCHHLVRDNSLTPKKKRHLTLKCLHDLHGHKSIERMEQRAEKVRASNDSSHPKSLRTTDSGSRPHTKNWRQSHHKSMPGHGLNRGCVVFHLQEDCGEPAEFFRAWAKVATIICRWSEYSAGLLFCEWSNISGMSDLPACKSITSIYR